MNRSTRAATVQRPVPDDERGYLSQSELAAYFGLGQAGAVDRVTVRWPGRDGKTQEWQNLAPGASYRLKEGSPNAERVGR